MRAAVQRVMNIAALMVLGVALLMSQAAKSPIQQPPEETKPVPVGPATPPTAEEAESSAKTSTKLPAVPTAAPVDPKTFVIGPEDILGIRVWREPELSTGAQVRPDGKITLPLIGEVTAAGETPEALKNKIVEMLTEYINKPEVIVSVQSVQSRKFYVSGEVGRPGTYPLVVPTTILQAVTNAGGFKEFANTKRITVLRNGKVLKFNFNEVVKGKNMQQNVMLENGDYIVVP